MTRVIQLYVFLKNLYPTTYNLFWFKLKNVTYVSFPKIIGKLYLKGSGKLLIGNGAHINSGKNANPIGGDTRTIFAISKGASLSIGDNTGISNVAIICQEKITIGNYVKIGGSVKIYDTDFHSLSADDRKYSKSDIPKTRPVSIGDHCFIGAHSIILKGVSIGRNSIIGAGSVVAKSIPSGEIWAGNPAKFIKKTNDV